MTDKEINKECPHINLTDWGVYSCKLYDPYISDKKAFVHYGTCKANTHCPYKQLRRKEQECEKLKETINKLSKSVILPMPKSEVINLTDRYKQALEKIQEYCIHYLKHNPKSPAIDLNDIVKILNEVNS